MIKPLSKLSESEQDRLFYVVMDKINGPKARREELENLLATLYLNGSVKKGQVAKMCPSFESAKTALNALRNAGASIRLGSTAYRLFGFDDGFETSMVFKTTYLSGVVA